MSTLPSGLPELVDDGECLARFLTQSNEFTSQQVKPRAFLPSPKDRETSLFRHGRQPTEVLWSLGFEAAGSRSLYGAAFLTARDVRSALLDVMSDEPPLRHAVIRGWPYLENDLELQKAQQKERAMALASAAGAPLMRS
jgi:hypothetical protein